jgi:hypothetical protein
MNNVMFLSSVNFKFNNGTLESVDASSIDRTGQVLEELGTTAITLAKAAARADNANLPPHDQAQMATERYIDQLYLAIAKEASTGGDPAKLAALQTQLKSARALIMDLRQNLDPPLRTWPAYFTVLLDPDAPTRTKADYLEYEIKPPQLFPDVPPENMDVVLVRIYDQNRREFLDSLHGDRRPADTGGVLYRQPIVLLTKVLAGDPDDEMTEIFSGLVSYVQFSPPAVAAIDSKVFTQKRTTLVFDTVRGGLVSYGISQDSPAENAAKTLADVSNSAVQAENPKPQGTGKVTAGSGSSTRSAQTKSASTQSGGTADPTIIPPQTRTSTQPGSIRGGGRGGAATAPGGAP